MILKNRVTWSKPLLLIKVFTKHCNKSFKIMHKHFWFVIYESLKANPITDNGILLIVYIGYKNIFSIVIAGFQVEDSTNWDSKETYTDFKRFIVVDFT